MAWTSRRSDPDHFNATIEAPLARDEVARLRLGAWSVVAPRLILRLRPADGNDETALSIGAAMVAVVALELDHGIARIGPSQLLTWGRPLVQVVKVARANSVTQSLHRLTTVVVDGPDQGARITVLGGGPGTGGLVLDLDRVIDRGDVVDALIVVAGDHIVLIGQPPPATGPDGRRALALRLMGLGRTGFVASARSSLPPLHVMQFREPGRLAMFEPKDS